MPITQIGFIDIDKMTLIGISVLKELFVILEIKTGEAGYAAVGGDGGFIITELVIGDVAWTGASLQDRKFKRSSGSPRHPGGGLFPLILLYRTGTSANSPNSANDPSTRGEAIPESESMVARLAPALT